MAKFPPLLTNRPLPPYTYIPGRFPHPVSDPAGHSHGLEAKQVTPLSRDNWSSCEAYLHGFDLFNHGYYWEAHEAWESCWHAAGRQGKTADFLKGLIKMAAAGVKHLQGQPAGVFSHSCRACQLWNQDFSSLESGEGNIFGLAARELQEMAETICNNGWPDQLPSIFPAMPD
jgi:hypothetical protein